ncbi:50S ribosomal protein L29 [Desulfogranum marinum]|jgi:large subunit ribosomal protein L29|uniref:50S ribosomal protein L29 n=1 Tax=Desulfogranum marinum TaxID=453220 RepID=UPI001965DEC1|nr:50S ribosomal protein L29 [Desulfogranum marinum]MBM9511182.1 50S ribosomal protein L29 [Desulfogranum marinum]
MKIKDLRELSLEDLGKKEQDFREDLFKLKFQHGIRRLENPARLAQLKKDIARVLTVIAEKQ